MKSSPLKERLTKAGFETCTNHLKNVFCLKKFESYVKKKDGGTLSFLSKSPSQELTDLNFLSKIGQDVVTTPHGMVSPTPEIGKPKKPLDISLKPKKEEKSY